MKQGSTDDPFADDGDAGADTERDESRAADTDGQQHVATSPPADDSGLEDSGLDDSGLDESNPDEQADDDGAGPGRLPYIYARESVKDGRQQRPIFLRDEVEDGIPELVGELETVFGENVYRTDVMEAAVEIAQEHPDLVADKLGEWGYGWD